MNDGREFIAGFIGSIFGHIGLLILLTTVSGGLGDFGAPIVYSVSIESGEKLGGISQAPKDPDKKSIPTPPTKEKPKQEEEAIPEKPDPEAEVSIAKETPKPTPKATEKPTPKPTKKPTPKPTPKNTPKPKPKSKATPKKKSTPKPKPKPKQQSLDDINKALERAVKKYTGESTDAGGGEFGSTGQGGRDFGGGTQRPPEFFRYQEMLERHVKGGWRWHDPSVPLRASVCFRLAENGDMSDITLCASSGDQKFDSSVFRAVQKANPAPMPPGNVYDYFRRVRITFTPQTF